MAVIYMVHPAHGAKVAISDEEANYDPITSTVLADDDEDDEPVNEMAVPKRRGRPRAKQEG